MLRLQATAVRARGEGEVNTIGGYFVSGGFSWKFTSTVYKVVFISIPVLLSPRQLILPHFPGKKEERSHKSEADSSHTIQETQLLACHVLSFHSHNNFVDTHWII